MFHLFFSPKVYLKYIFQRFSHINVGFDYLSQNRVKAVSFGGWVSTPYETVNVDGTS